MVSDFWIPEALSTVPRRWLWWHVSFSQWAVESVRSLGGCSRSCDGGWERRMRTCQRRGHDRGSLTRRTSEEVRRCSEQRCLVSALRVSKSTLGPQKKRWKILPLVKDNVSSVKVLLLINGDSLLSLMYRFHCFTCVIDCFCMFLNCLLQNE